MAHVQRQVADEALAPGPAHAGQEPPAPPPAGLDMPLAQRQPVETPVPRKEEAPPAAVATPLVQRQEAEQEAEIESPAAPVVEAAPPGRPERPLAQRQPAVTAPPPAQQLGEEKAPPAAEVRPPTPSAIENAVPAGPEMPLVQWQAAEATPGPAQPPRQEEALPAAPEMSQVQPQGVEIGPPVAPVIEAAPPRQGPKMPTVQRQTAVTPPAPAPLQEEGAAPASEAKPLSPSASAETPLAAAPAALQARPELPLVQRLTREEAPQAEVGPAQVQRVSAPGEPAAGLEGEVVARAAPRARLPLVEPPPPSQAEVIRTKPVEQTAILPQARVQARPEGSPEPPALAPSRPVTPPEPRQAAPTSGLPTRSGWTQAAAGELPLPPVLQRSAAPARPASTAWIQRQPEAPAPSQVVTPRSEPWRERVVQRADGATPETPPSTVAPPPQPPAPESAPPNLDSLARQIYPLIKRMLAVERERKWGR
jgi:DNA polymerase-3 subunit gamma/tau